MQNRGIVYKGRHGHDVWRGARRLPLAPSLRLRNHSPTGFSWGYGGSGPAQLALALLYDVTGDPEPAKGYYQAFKWAVVAQWPMDGTWEITANHIRVWLDGERDKRLAADRVGVA